LEWVRPMKPHPTRPTLIFFLAAIRVAPLDRLIILASRGRRAL
jgi:hypothetical protein